MAKCKKSTAGIILAAGKSSRFGSSKIMLEWDGEALIHRLARISIEAELSPVLVVLGANVDAPIQALSDLPARIIINDEWERGMSSSLSTGIRGLTEEVDGALMILGDQPYLTVEFIHAIVDAAEAGVDAVIPRFEGKPGHPVFWRSETFPKLAGLTGDVGARVLFDTMNVVNMDWDNEKILLDIDTPEDLESFRHNA
ncbi:MAG: nucleotidyltransferase family protein [Anaerolineaceae bacterium]|nr:nucleotidyltransferase family protein [Anaerolineaceae bacterium]